MNLTVEEYEAREGLRQSQLQAMLKSPAHFLAKLKNPVEPTAAMRFGMIVDKAVFEQESFIREHVVAPFSDRRTKEAKLWFEDNKHRLILTSDEAEKVAGMTTALWSHPQASMLLEGRFQECLFGVDPETGVKLKGRIDCLRDDLILVDYKTTQDASRDGFSKSIANFNYHFQAAFYWDLCAINGIEPRAFVFVAQEKEPPYGIMCHQLDDQAIEVGRRRYRRALEKYALCVNQNKWPGYEPGIHLITLPVWAVGGEEFYD